MVPDNSLFKSDSFLLVYVMISLFGLLALDCVDYIWESVLE